VQENAKTFFDAAMECITADLKTRIINSANDETGLCFFNTVQCPAVALVDHVDVSLLCPETILSPSQFFIDEKLSVRS
jgi:hypothetical protein